MDTRIRVLRVRGWLLAGTATLLLMVLAGALSAARAADGVAAKTSTAAADSQAGRAVLGEAFSEAARRANASLTEDIWVQLDADVLKKARLAGARAPRRG